MNKYEVVYIIDPAVEEEARKELIAKFNDLITGNGGNSVFLDDAGIVDCSDTYNAGSG